jgi:hypothetical protein
MDLHTWLDLPENKGKASWLADQFGINKAAVSFWRESGVPLDRMQRVHELTEGAVTVADMVAHKIAYAERSNASKAAA